MGKSRKPPKDDEEESPEVDKIDESDSTGDAFMGVGIFQED